MQCSSNLQATQTRDMGRLLLAKLRLPFLNTGVTLSVFQSLGIISDDRDWLNSDVRTGAKWIASSLRTLFGILSGLYMSSPLRSFRMPPSEMKRFEILGKGVPGRIGVPFWSESWTKTDSNC